MQGLLSAIQIEPYFLYSFLAGIILTYLVLRFLAIPLKYVWKVSAVVVKGAAVILLINAVGIAFAVQLPFNACNTIVVGALGIPGVVLIFAIQSVLT